MNRSDLEKLLRYLPLEWRLWVKKWPEKLRGHAFFIAKEGYKARLRPKDLTRLFEKGTRINLVIINMLHNLNDEERARVEDLIKGLPLELRAFLRLPPDEFLEIYSLIDFIQTLGEYGLRLLKTAFETLDVPIQKTNARPEYYEMRQIVYELVQKYGRDEVEKFIAKAESILKLMESRRYRTRITSAGAQVAGALLKFHLMGIDTFDGLIPFG